MQHTHNPEWQLELVADECVPGDNSLPEFELEETDAEPLFVSDEPLPAVIPVAEEHAEFGGKCLFAGIILLLWVTIRFAIFAGTSWGLVGWVAAVFFLSIVMATALHSKLGIFLLTVGVPLCGLVGAYLSPASFSTARPWAWWSGAVVWVTAMVGCGGFASLVQGASANFHQGVAEAQRVRPPRGPLDE